jgi:hypothetical protein
VSSKHEWITNFVINLAVGIMLVYTYEAPVHGYGIIKLFQGWHYLQRRSLAPSQVAKRISEDNPVTSERVSKRSRQESCRKPLAQLSTVQQQPRTPEVISEHVSMNYFTH